MKKVKESLVGKHFGKLTVLKREEDRVDSKGRLYDMWLCECDCENHNRKIIWGASLKNGNTRSCGCLRKESSIQNRENNKKHNQYKLNLFDEHGEYGVGYCSNTGREFYFDMEDYDLIKDYCWHENDSQDAYPNMSAWNASTKGPIFMHWIVADKFYDHADRNPFDNRKYNLRPATYIENARNRNKQRNNTSGFIGVSYMKSKNKWCAYITVDYKRKYLGYFDDKDEAIRARLNAEKKYFGEFAPQKELFEKYNI